MGVGLDQQRHVLRDADNPISERLGAFSQPARHGLHHRLHEWILGGGSEREEEEGGVDAAEGERGEVELA